MSNYGDQWRERREHRDSLFCGYCLCGRRLLRTWQNCICGQPNDGYKPKKQTHTK